MPELQVELESVISSQKRYLISYKGGGYDGCCYEQNYCLLTEEGFFDVFSTGCFAIRDMEQLRRRWTYKPEEIELFDLSDQEEINRFCREEPVGFLLGVARWMSEEGFSYRFEVACDVCKVVVPVVEAVGVHPECVGGITIMNQDIVCSGCEALGTCAYCGAYVPEDMADPETTDNGYCKWCEKKHGKKS